MSWFTTFVRPRIKALIEKKEVPDNLWHKCAHCEQMIFRKDLITYQYVCRHCNYHMRMPVKTPAGINFFFFIFFFFICMFHKTVLFFIFLGAHSPPFPKKKKGLPPGAF